MRNDNEGSFLAFINFLDNREGFAEKLKQYKEAKDKAEDAISRMHGQMGEIRVREETLQHDLDEIEPRKQELINKEKALKKEGDGLQDLRKKLDEKKQDLDARVKENRLLEKILTAKGKDLAQEKIVLQNIEKGLQEKEDRITEKENKLRTYLENA